MELSIFISVLALLVSLYTFYLNYKLRKKSALSASYISNAAKLSDLAADLKDNPALLRFYGITEKDLEESGINHIEFSYLYRNFLIGSIYHLTEESDNRKSFKENTYRYKLLESEHTRRAWPMIKKKIALSNYVRRVDATIEKIENKAANNGNRER